MLSIESVLLQQLHRAEFDYCFYLISGIIFNKYYVYVCSIRSIVNPVVAMLNEYFCQSMLDREKTTHRRTCNARDNGEIVVVQVERPLLHA